jgi:hypothetical protein
MLSRPMMEFFANDPLLRVATVLGVLCALGSEIWYIRQIKLGHVCCSLSGFFVFFSSTLLGGGATAAMSGWEAGIVPLSFATFHVAMLYVAYVSTHHSGWDHLDSVLLVAALTCGIGWLTFDAPWLALMCGLGIDVIGYVAVFRKMRQHPGKEDTPAWFFAGLAYGLPVLVLLLRMPFDWKTHSFSLLNASAGFVVTVINVCQQRRTSSFAVTN